VKQKQRLISGFHAMQSNFERSVYATHFFIILLLILFSNNLLAQDLKVLKGVITSEKGELLSGVTVQVKNTRLITQSNREGEYLLSKVPVNVSLIFSRLGFKDLSLELELISDKENIKNIIYNQLMKFI
jgi:CarboxypepD_reg-like domain